MKGDRKDRAAAVLTLVMASLLSCNLYYETDNHVSHTGPDSANGDAATDSANNGDGGPDSTAADDTGVDSSAEDTSADSNIDVARHVRTDVPVAALADYCSPPCDIDYSQCELDTIHPPIRDDCPPTEENAVGDCRSSESFFDLAEVFYEPNRGYYDQACKAEVGEEYWWGVYGGEMAILRASAVALGARLCFAPTAEHDRYYFIAGQGAGMGTRYTDIISISATEPEGSDGPTGIGCASNVHSLDCLTNWSENCDVGINLVTLLCCRHE